VLNKDGQRREMIISVASGKGGTGKTLVATSLALSLKDKYRVQILDCDVEEPNDHIFLKPNITHSEAVSVPVPNIDEKKCTHCGKCAEVCAYHAIAVLGEYVLTFPELCHGCGACGYLCPEKAISEIPYEIGVIETGQSNGIAFGHGKLAIGQAMAPPVIRKVKRLINRDRVVIIDASPGTSCPVVEAIKGSDFCLLVTEPTPFGLNDLVLTVETVRQLGIPCGIVLNRAGVGDGKTEQYCARENIPILLTIPLDMNIASLYSQGVPLVEGMPDYKRSFIELYEKIGAAVNEGSGHSKR
jgi:MinD superfamily P-loop ATPase